MHIRFRGAAALFACFLLWSHGTALHAASDVRELPASPESRSAAGTDYALRTTSWAGATVTLIDVHSDGGDWLKVDAAKLPALPMQAPESSRDSVQWFYGTVAGWMAVPTGWRVQHAAVGVDGNAHYVFTASEGASGGWVGYDVFPACEECLLQAAEALLPNAGERLGARNDAPPISLGQTNPVMSWQSRPDDCTALFRYRANGLTVHAAVLSSVPIAATSDAQKGALALADVYAALPAAKSATAEFLLSSFGQDFPACRAPNGWAL